LESTGLERELRPQAQRRGELEDRALPKEGVINWRHTRSAAVDALRRVLANRALLIGHVEPVEGKAQLFALTNRERIVDADVPIIGRRCASAVGGGVERRATRY